MLIGYGKLGRSMPLTLEKCGNLGGDVEMVAVVKEMALRHPNDTFILLGRNTGEEPSKVGLPMNVLNPWIEWAPELRARMNANGINHPNLSIEEHFKVQAMFDDLTLETFIALDGFVQWIGQHGTSNCPIPKVGNPGELTKPQDAFGYYAGFMLRGINHWRDADPWNREEVNLNADARNLHKMRDLKWPMRHPVLGQHNSWKNIKHERYGDGRDWEEWSAADYAALERPEDRDRVWLSRVYTTYARLEVNGLRPGTPFGDLISFNDSWDDRGHFGLFINEARSIGINPKMSRRVIFDEWVRPLLPDFVHGTWSPASLQTMGMNITPVAWDQYYPKLHSVRSTFTTPSSGSGWATAKPWEAFAAGTVCFFHPAYDDQNNILSDAPTWLQNWLRVKTPTELAVRVSYLNSTAGQRDWVAIVKAQRTHFDNALTDLTYMRMIEERIWK
jgi:hypothetical protein